LKTKTISSLVVFALVLISFNTLLAQPTAPAGWQWVAVSELTDEFNGASLDGNKWIPYHPYWSGRSPSQFNQANVSIGGGYLKLKSTVANANQTGNWIWSSCVTSKTKAMKPGTLAFRKSKIMEC
jgi:hypothetical protein